MKLKLWTGRKLPLVVHCGAWLADAGFKSEESAMVAIYKNTLIAHQVKNDEDD